MWYLESRSELLGDRVCGGRLLACNRETLLSLQLWQCAFPPSLLSHRHCLHIQRSLGRPFLYPDVSLLYAALLSYISRRYSSNAILQLMFPFRLVLELSVSCEDAFILQQIVGRSGKLLIGV